jgi:hypothetical protein
MTGVNVDPENLGGAPGPADLKKAGFTWVRLVSRPGVESYVEWMQASGLMVLAVVAKESEGHVFGGPDAWQFGNEPDSSGPASWTMTSTEYRDQFNYYQDTYPQLVWISAGLASGQTAYWQHVKDLGGLNGASGFAVHPYNKTASQASTLLKAYQKITPTLPLWVTEFNRPVAEIPAFTSMLRQLSVASAWFSYGGQADPQFNVSPTQIRMLSAAA